MNRRSFLSSCLALAAAPAIVRADSLMRIVPRYAGVITFYGGGIVVSQPIQTIAAERMCLGDYAAAIRAIVDQLGRAGIIAIDEPTARHASLTP